MAVAADLYFGLQPLQSRRLTLAGAGISQLCEIPPPGESSNPSIKRSRIREAHYHNCLDYAEIQGFHNERANGIPPAKVALNLQVESLPHASSARPANR